MEKKIAPCASVFGAALASMLVAPELQADVVELTFIPATNPFSAFGGYATVSMPEVGASFFQWNNNFLRTMSVYSYSLNSIAVVNYSQTLSPSTFSGTSQIVFTANSSGTQYVGFRFGNNVGWFSFSVAGFGTDIHYLEGAYGNNSESVHVGTVPSPGALALLALGAVGIRRKRKRAA